VAAAMTGITENSVLIAVGEATDSTGQASAAF
jgi:hypothetical protein